MTTVSTGTKSHSSLEHFSKWIKTIWWHSSRSKAKNKNYMVYFKTAEELKTDWKTYDIPSSSKLYKQQWHLQSSACLLKCGFSSNVCWHLSLCAELTGRTTVCALFFLSFCSRRRRIGKEPSNLYLHWAAIYCEWTLRHSFPSVTPN